MKQIRPFGLISFVLILWFTHAYSQNISKKVELFNEMEGSMILDIEPDSQGHLWITTLGGLVKYNGYEFEWFHNDPLDQQTIGDLLTYQVYQDSSDRIWIGAMGNIYLYDPKTRLFKTYVMEVDFPEWGNAFVGRMADDRHGRIYFGVNSGSGAVGSNALLYFDEQSGLIKGLEKGSGQKFKNIYHMTNDSEGNVIAIARNGVFMIEPSHQITNLSSAVRADILDNEYVSGIETTSDGTIWLTTNQSRLHSTNVRNGQHSVWSMAEAFPGKSSSGYSSAIASDGKGNLWIANEIGLLKFNISEEQFDLVLSSTQLSLDFGSALILKFDSFENLWIGTRSKGLIKISNQNMLTSYKHDPDDPSSISEGWVSRIFESDDGSIWVPTNDQAGFEGLNRLDLETGAISKILYRDILPDYQYIYMINKIRPGEVLFLSQNEYFIYNVHTKEVKGHDCVSKLNGSVFVNDVITDNEGNLWLCTNGGLFKEKDNISTHFDLMTMEGTTSSSNEVTKILVSSSNVVWALTNGGLFSIDNSIIKRHGYDSLKGDVFPTQDINSIYEDQNGMLWVGTWQGGLCRYDAASGKIKIYGLSDGLPSLSIQGILGDENNGILWLSTFAGISQFNIQEEQFINYSHEDGIQGRLFSDGSYLKTSNGLFLFGGSNGITIIDPEEMIKKSIPPKTHISNFNVGNNSYIIYDNSNQSEFEQKLSFDQNNISIEYEGIHYDNTSKNNFSYQLVGYDLEWRNVANQRSAYYYNLPHGNYTFKVKSSNNNGVWNEQPASIGFSIAPPWWLTWWAYVLYGCCFILGVFAVDRIQRRRLIKLERQQAQEKELAQGREIEKAYKELKATQSQLIQSEKMASLGELTAGIAHEIQNPLNFVNNFSEVSKELVGEMNEELDKGDIEEAKEIGKDINQNLEKIHHHGQRASSIVKGMLEHSRTGDKKKELTDINQLADEYLRLSYHGLRAKDKSFNADFRIEKDENLPKVNVIAQDIGRVLLNLINNAFYASSSKASASDDSNYKPLVIVKTKMREKSIEISVKDNGPGIPENIKDKIFQPFFTTKPTGQGTGLGLSLSYDIIAKGHNGILEVDSVEGLGTEFVIQLPV